MSEDYYKTLGVGRSASQEEIEKAYQGLARKYHPDLNPDDKTAKKKFQRVQAAYDVLKDAQKRKLYDLGGTAAVEGGGAGPQPGGPGFGGGGVPGQMPEGFEDILSSMFGGRGGGGFEQVFGARARGNGRRGRAPASRSAPTETETDIEIPFQLAVTGGKTELAIDRGDRRETIRVTIPAGVDEGKKIRLRGQGPGDPESGQAGDLLLRIHVGGHPSFTRKGDDLYVKLPVTLLEAVRGSKVDVPTPKGTVALRVPPGTSSGKRLRVKGHGVAAKGRPSGDLYAEVQIVLPPNLDDASLAQIEQLDARHPTPDPRAALRW